MMQMPSCGKDGDDGVYDDRRCNSPAFAVADYAERRGDGRAHFTILHCNSFSFDY